MDAEERVFDDDEKQRAWLEGCRSEEAISRLLERHGDKRLLIKAGLARVSANPAVLQDLRRATLLRGQRNFDRFYREANFETPPAPVKPSIVRTWPADILTIDSQIQKTFHILIPRWRLTLGIYSYGRMRG